MFAVQIQIHAEMPESNPITLYTVWLALVCYAIVVAFLLAGCRGHRWRNLMRPLWTIGCIAIVIHVVAAFHYTHHWSEADAIDSTARRDRTTDWHGGRRRFVLQLLISAGLDC